jgi:hypothetical protein
LRHLFFFNSSRSIKAGMVGAALLIAVPRSVTQAVTGHDVLCERAASTNSFGVIANSSGAIANSVGATTNSSYSGACDSNASEESAGLPDAPVAVSNVEPMMMPFSAAMGGGGGRERFDVEPAVTVHTDSFSRIAIGAGISVLGGEVNSALVLSQIFDARVTADYFGFNTRRIDVDGVDIYPGLHFSSTSATVDFYPFNMPIRLSAGLMFQNDNHAAATLVAAPGSNFTLNGQTFYAGGSASGAGSAPLTGNVALAFHTIRPAPKLTFGWGKFIPRSERHWSFPSEIGVAFTGAPAISVAMAGTVCTDPALTMCSNVADTTNPVGAEFNSQLQTRLASWRRGLNEVKIFPILSGGVSYSFDTPWGLERLPKARF